MTSLLLTLTNLVIAGVTLGLGTVKAFAARHEREWTLTLTASVLLCAGLIFLLATPVVYRTVGTAVQSPNISSLLVPVLTLVCVGHAHALSQLWQPHRNTPHGPAFHGSAMGSRLQRRHRRHGRALRARGSGAA